MPVLNKNFLMPENATSAVRSRWNAERSALVADVLSSHAGSRQTLRLRVHGESMLPTLWPGDVVEIESCSLEDVDSGDIVLAQREGRIFLHRVIARCAPNGFVTRGDSMPGPDPQFTSEALLGRLVRRQEAGQLSKATPRGGFASKWLGLKWPRALGIVLCYSGIARRLALRLHGGSTWTRGTLNDEAAAELESL